MPVIEVHHLTKYFDSNLAVNDLSFSIEEGEIVGLLGLNGAGKSTVLKILGTFLMPSSGKVFVGGNSVEDNPHAVRSMIGYLPDTPPLYDEMSVGHYLSFVAGLKRIPKSAVEAKVAGAMAKTNLQFAATQKLGELSHGFRQRVGIAQAIVNTPKVLILDEPINGLDPLQIVDMRDLILSFKGKHTVLLSSHNLSEITKTCDRILIIDDGHLVAQGREQDLAAKLAGATNIACEIAQVWEKAEDQLRKISGVQRVGVKPLAKGSMLEIEASRDVRAEVAQMIVQSGNGLLGLKKQDEGLERLFMKLIKPSAPKDRLQKERTP